MASVVMICICGCLMSLLLKQYQRPLAVLLGLAVCMILLLNAIPQIEEVFESIETFFSETGLQNTYMELICKALGITYLTQLGMDVCRDSGEQAICTAVEISGRVCLAVLSLPLFMALMDIVLEVIA